MDTVSAATCATPPDCAAVHAAAVGGACLAVALPHGAPRRTVFLATQHSLQCAGPTPRPSGVVRQAGHFPGFADLARCRPAEVLSEGLREITNDRRKSDPAQETHVGLRTQQSNLSLPVQLTVYPEVRTNSTIVNTNSIGWKPGALVFPFTSNRPTGIAPAKTPELRAFTGRAGRENCSPENQFVCAYAHSMRHDSQVWRPTAAVCTATPHCH